MVADLAVIGEVGKQLEYGDEQLCRRVRPYDGSGELALHRSKVTEPRSQPLSVLKDDQCSVNRIVSVQRESHHLLAERREGDAVGTLVDQFEKRHPTAGIVDGRMPRAASTDSVLLGWANVSG